MAGEVRVTKATTWKILKSGEKRRGDALALYHLYAAVAAEQGTTTVYATIPYAMAHLGWTEERTTAAKRVLRQLGLVETIQRRAKGGVMGKPYVKVNFLPSPEPPKTGVSVDSTGTPENRDPGKPGPR